MKRLKLCWSFCNHESGITGFDFIWCYAHVKHHPHGEGFLLLRKSYRTMAVQHKFKRHPSRRSLV